MNILAIGTLGSYLKNMSDNAKIRARGQNILKPVEKDAETDDPFKQIKMQLREMRRANNLSVINGKLMSGAALNQDELDYLRIHSPLEYEKAIRIKKEREEYKRELERCRSKEEVEHVSNKKLMGFCAEYRNIMSAKSLSTAARIEKLEDLRMRMAAAKDVELKFRATASYKSMPDKIKFGHFSLSKSLIPEAEETPRTFDELLDVLSRAVEGLDWSLYSVRFEEEKISIKT
jgi:hypothetical protein